MKRNILLIVTCLFFGVVKSQTPLEISGTLKDSTGYTVIGAAIKLTSPQDTLSTITDIDGKFTFRNLKSPQGSIAITALGYKTLTRRYNLGQSTSLTLSEIILTNDSKMLNEIVVDGTPDVIVKEDTLQFRADQYKLKDNALAEDLLKKLPGVEVDRDGNITTQGKGVTRVRVNGKDFFGGDVKTATQNLPADILENVQIIDDYGDQANLTGVKEGEPDKILNFTIRPDRNKGYLTNATVGAGTEERYQASVFAAKFNNNQQISVIANLNNTNANIFNLTQSGGGGGGRRGRSGGGGGGGFGSSGLTDVKSIGINYRDQWSTKVTAYGSYSLFGRENILESNTFRRNLATPRNGNVTIDDIREINAETDNLNHRFDFNLEYKIDTLNYLKVTPRVSFSTTDSRQISDFRLLRNDSLSSDGLSTDINSSRSPNLGADFLYNHKFAGTKRNLSVSAFFNTSATKSDQDFLNESLEYSYNPIETATELYQRQLIGNDNTSNNVNINTSFIEPLTKTKSLEFNYEYGYNKISNNRTVLNADFPNSNPVINNDLSNEYDYSFATNRIGLNYRVREEKYNYTFGLGLQPSVLKGDSPDTDTPPVRNTALNIFPAARFQYKFSKSKEFNINYNGRSNQPSYNQLQPVVDNSNPQFPVIGNSELDAEFTNRINLRFNNSNITSGTNFFSNVNFNFTKDKIVTTTRTINDENSRAIQERGYTNANGYYTINGFYAYSRQLKDKKYVFGLRGMANYNNNISFVDDQKNTGRNLVLSQRLQIQIQPNDWLEIVPAVNYTYNRNNNSLNQQSNTEIHTWSTAFDSKIYFTKTFIWGTQADKNFNRGFSNTNENPFIINTYLEKQFFKGNRGSLRLTAFDLLDESIAIARTVTDNYILDSRSNRLSRYFMLTFTMRINKFAGNSNTPPEMGGERRRMREGGGPGGRP